MDRDEQDADDIGLATRQDLIAAVMRAFPARVRPAYGRNSDRFRQFFDELPEDLVEGMLSFRMNMAMAKWRSMLDRAVGEYGLSQNAWHVLFAISMNGPDETMTDIANLLAAPNPAIVRILNDLEAAGLIQRKAHKLDKRAKSLSLTKRGEEVVTALFYDINIIRRKLTAGVSLAEMQLVTEIVDRMDVNLDEMLAAKD